MTSDDYEPFFSHDDQVIYRFKSLYASFYENKYITINTKTGASYESEVNHVKYNECEGLVVDYLIRGDVYYEILLFKQGKTNDHSRNGLVKRDLKTLEQIGELVIFDEIEIPYLGAGQGLEIMDGEDGIYVLAGSKYLKKHYLKKFSYNLNLIWSIHLDFLDQSGVVLQKTKFTSGCGSLLLTITFSEEPKTSFFSLKNNPTRSFGILLFLVNQDGTSIGIFPEFSENINVRDYSFNFYPNEHKFIGVFSTTQLLNVKKNETSGIGYS